MANYCELFIKMGEFYKELGLILNMKQVFPTLMLQLAQMDAQGRSQRVSLEELHVDNQGGGVCSDVREELPLQLEGVFPNVEEVMEHNDELIQGVEIINSMGMKIEPVIHFLTNITQRIREDDDFRMRVSEVMMMISSQNAFSVAEALRTNPALQQTINDMRICAEQQPVALENHASELPQLRKLQNNDDEMRNLLQKPLG